MSDAQDLDRLEQFEEFRPLLFSIAYRLLGSVAEAEDVVQETWLSWAATTTTADSPRAHLSAVVTRLSINVLRSARVRRQQYVGPWLPEPLLEDPYEDPERSAELADSVSMASLLLLERLTPLERAVFVLREVFDFDYDEIAATVGRSAGACRQLGARARRHMHDGRPRFEAERTKREDLSSRFFEALQAGEVGRLRELLAADVNLIGDSGGKGPQFAEVIAGAEKVGKVLGVLVPPFLRIGGTIEPRTVNGHPGAILRGADGGVVNTFALEIADGRVQTIRSVINPDKLRHLGPVTDAWAVLAATRDQAARSAVPGPRPQSEGDGDE